MKKAMVILGVGIVLLIGVWVGMSIDNQRLQDARGAAFVDACVARPHVWATIDGVRWDLNACG